MIKADILGGEHDTGLSAWALSATTRVFRKGEGVANSRTCDRGAEVGVPGEGLSHFWKLKKTRDQLLP